MNALDEVVSMMSLKDKKSFVTYLGKKNKRKDVHNINFFKLLETDDINTLKNRYKTKKSADVYHALRKRMYDSLIAFMANRTFEYTTSAEHEVLRLLVVARAFLEHNLYKTAFKCLAKAETKALTLEQFSLLNEIYHTQIQFAHIEGSPQLDGVIAKFTANRQKLYYEEQLNLGYALLRKELADIYHKGKIVDLRALIQNTIKSLNISLDEVLTFKSLYQILFIANEYASINSDYSLITSFVNKSLPFIQDKKELAGKHLYYHIYVLYFIANIYFRNREFATSLRYLELMQEQMQVQNKKYYKRFFMRWSLLLGLNQHYTNNPDAAKATIQKALNQQKGDVTDLNDLLLCMVVFYSQQADKTAFKYMRQFAHTDSWYEKRMGMDWAIKKALVEIILQAEFDNQELALSRIKGFKRRYKKYLTDVKEGKVLEYVQLAEKYILNADVIYTKLFNDKLQELMAMATATQDVFVLSFIAWLYAKTQNKPVYEVTLSLLNESATV
ncbi:hypothetical protein DVK85_05785 [Flavobacterium arcticum]|uniref:Tetratricopeptide repeat protein n=1 Tax=Flavobacterium arcticum TaxID=1784713 RepID=A0A345HB10_9FLAO|nr:hypothetical protein [Flavobacterium arcticum]AXG73770.1 hypothetical protein DVK85_05785 [Flavobacterium arcticum]KAF2511722.1 hypothetical protein E0W72_05295 [Flavobacterium arcticum]